MGIVLTGWREAREVRWDAACGSCCSITMHGAASFAEVEFGEGMAGLVLVMIEADGVFSNSAQLLLEGGL